MEKITKGHPFTQSPDFIKQNIETLKSLFPTIVKEGKIDFEELKSLLDEELEIEDEFYRFTWAGKSMARREATKPSTATLRPCKEESKNWDTTQNIFIEGDNLEVLKLLQKSYSSKIKMIYIDPPYNTGKDFVYRDDYKDNLGNYLAITNQLDDEGKRKSTNTESDGRYHSNWLNMMYPRLKLAKNLLTEDGVIFISIDDNEISNLRKLCDEILGEDNFVVNFIWEQGRKSAATSVAINHEYCLVYSKNKQLIISINNELNRYWKDKKEGLELIYRKVDELYKQFGNDYTKMSVEMKGFYKSFNDGNPVVNNKHYCYFDKVGLYFPDNAAAPDKPETRSHKPLIHPNGKETAVPKLGWRYNEETLQKLVVEDRIHFGEDETKVPCVKRYLKETEYEVTPSVFYKDGRGASNRLSQLMESKCFDFPKDEGVIANFINYCVTKEDRNQIILDFFAGSGTTAHASIQLNSEDGCNRKFICVQLPELTEKDSEAFKAGYFSIADICKERIRRAGEKIVSEKREELNKLKTKIEGKMLQDDVQQQIDELEKNIKTLDIGFKVFKLDSSNINTWDGDPEKIEQSLFNAASNIKESRTEDDILFEILLKYGLDLSQPIEQKVIYGKTVYNIGVGSLFICLADGITTNVADKIGKWKEELIPATCKVIFKDTGFTDVEKTNSIQILKRYGIEEVNTI